MASVFQYVVFTDLNAERSIFDTIRSAPASADLPSVGADFANSNSIVPATIGWKMRDELEKPGCYNARKSSLKTAWRGLFGHTHGIVVASHFYESVQLHENQQRSLAPGEAEQSVEIVFTPEPKQDLLIACLWRYVEPEGDAPGFYSFAVITRDQPPEVRIAGHGNPSSQRLNRNMNFKVFDAYHDAELRGIDSSDATNIVLLFRLEGGQKESLLLRGCEFFRVTDFVAQNVVSRLLVFQGQNIDQDSVVEKLRWATSSCDASSFLGQERLDDIIAKIQGGKRSLLVLEPSWGAELVVLFEDMSS